MNIVVVIRSYSFLRIEEKGRRSKVVVSSMSFTRMINPPPTIVYRYLMWMKDPSND